MLYIQTFFLPKITHPTHKKKLGGENNRFPTFSAGVQSTHSPKGDSSKYFRFSDPAAVARAAFDAEQIGPVGAVFRHQGDFGRLSGP